MPALDGGLAGALAAACVTRGGPRVEIDVDPRAEGLADGLVRLLVREFVTNAVRHSGCTRVQIEITLTAGFLTIDVDDDGRGLDREVVREAVSRGHGGLKVARERITRHGGGLDLLDAPGGGAHIHVRVPVDAPGRPSVPGDQSVGVRDR